MNTGSKLLSVALVGAFVSMAFGSTPTSDELLAKANAQASKEKKNVLVMYHASWCGWCHKLDDMLKSKEVGPTMEKAYVVVHLVIDESPDKKALENAGGDKLRVALGGEKAGLPFFAVLSPSGKKLATSLAPKTGNIGYPAAPHEIAHFMVMLRDTAPKISGAERAKVEAYLKDVATKEHLVPAGTTGGGR